MDVRQVPKKMDAKEEGYRCWSKMQRLAICSDHPFGRSAEAEFENLSAFYGCFWTNEVACTLFLSSICLPMIETKQFPSPFYFFLLLTFPTTVSSPV